MADPRVRALLQIGLIIGAAAFGLFVLVNSVTSQEGGELSVGATPTSTLTPDELSTYSERAQREERAIVDAIVSELISNGESVADLPRGRTTAMGLEPATVDEALLTAGAVVIGTVRDQYLRRGELKELPDIPVTLLVSKIELDDGSTVELSQGVGVAREPLKANETAKLKLYGSSTNPLLEPEGQYLVLAEYVRADRTLRIVHGHAYQETSDGTLKALVPRPGNSRVEGVDATDLVSEFYAAHQ